VADTGGIDERARLEAIVYGRSGVTDAERAAATAALRALTVPAAFAPAPAPPSEAMADESTTAEAPAPWSPLAPLPGPRRVTRYAVGILSTLALVGAVAVTPTPAAFADSLQVFDRPQTGADAAAASEHGNLPGAGPDVDVDSVRLVAEPASGIDVLVYRTVRGEVCLAIMLGRGRGGGGSCVAEADFRADGMSGGTLFPPSGWRYDWGPIGDPVITAPLTSP